EDVILAVVHLQLGLFEVLLVAPGDLHRRGPRLQEIGGLAALPLERLFRLRERRGGLDEVGRWRGGGLAGGRGPRLPRAGHETGDSDNHHEDRRNGASQFPPPGGTSHGITGRAQTLTPGGGELTVGRSFFGPRCAKSAIFRLDGVARTLMFPATVKIAAFLAAAAVATT